MNKNDNSLIFRDADTGKELEQYGVWIKNGPEDLICEDAEPVGESDAPDGLDFSEDEAVFNTPETAGDISGKEPDITGDGADGSTVFEAHAAEAVPVREDSGSRASRNDASTEILLKIANELSSLKSEITHLKTEISSIKAQNSNSTEEKPAAGQDKEDGEDGFFDYGGGDDEETGMISLTDTELNGILKDDEHYSRAGLSGGGPEDIEDIFEAPVIEDLLKPEELPEAAATADGEPFEAEAAEESKFSVTPEYTELPVAEVPAGEPEPAGVFEDRGPPGTEEQSPEEPEFAGTPEDTGTFETVVPVDESELADIFESLETLETEEHTPEEPEFSVIGEDAELPEMEIPVDDSEPVKTTKEPELPEIEIPADDSEPAKTAEDMELPEIEVPADDSEPAGITEDTEPPGTETAPKEEPESKEAAGDTPPDGTGVLPGEAEMSPGPAVEEESAPAEQEEEKSAGGLSTDDETLRNEIKTVLVYMDQLLEALPEEKIREFAASDEFELYKKVFKELGLV